MCSTPATAGEALAAVTATIGGLTAVAPAPELIHELLATQHRLGAVVVEWLRAVEESGAWRDDGAVSAAAWLRDTAGLAHGDAARRLTLGRELEALPVAREAMAAG